MVDNPLPPESLSQYIGKCDLFVLFISVRENVILALATQRILPFAEIYAILGPLLDTPKSPFDIFVAVVLFE